MEIFPKCFNVGHMILFFFPLLMEKTFALCVSADALEADFRIFNLITGVLRTARETD